MSDVENLDLFGGGDGEPDRESAEVAEGGRHRAERDGGPAGPKGDEPRVWTVSQVNRAVRSLLEGSVDPLWVGGEVAGWTRARSGHRYFTLKDDRAQIRCVMWERDARQLPADPEEGMQVRVYGYLTLYEARGSYQLSVQRIEAEGAEGLWRLAFEKLRRRLQEEGLLDPARKRPLPRYPRCVGVVTSPTGAALRDVLTVLRRRAPWVRVLVRGARVQGEGASGEVARALEELAGTGRCDVVIVGRGGGSIEDLWAFNEEPVARAVAACPVPVVSAVGHEVDVTISDLVADARAATPSAAAEAVVPDAEALAEQLRRVPARLARGLRGSVERRGRVVADRLEMLRRGMERRLGPLRQTVDLGTERLERAVRRRVQDGRQRLAALAGKLEALSPLATLERGYAVARTEDGQVLRRVDDFPVGRRFLLRVIDGSVVCETVDATTTEETA